MKKLLVLIFSILIIFAGLVTYFGINKRTNIEFYSIPEAKGFVIDKDRELELEFYSKSKAPEFLSIDTTVFIYELDSESFTLENVEIAMFDIGDYYLVKLKASMPNILNDELNSLSSSLSIVTTSYTLKLNMGSVAFLKATKYKLLSVSELYASYSYLNGYLYITGLNITLSNDYSFMSLIRMGDFLYGNLSKALFDIKYTNILDSEIAKNYTLKGITKEYNIGLTSNTLFIPIGHRSLTLFRFGYLVLVLDSEYYYLDTFNFMANSYDPSEYQGLMEGGILNAKGY